MADPKTTAWRLWLGLAAALSARAQPATNTPAEGLRGIKGPVEIPDPYGWLWWLLIGAALALLGWWLWRKFRRKDAEAKPAIVIPPHRRAKDRLRGAGQLISDPYQFCSLVSDVVRVYLEERFDLHAPERTTEEFLEEMRRSPVLQAAQKAMLEQFLIRCDLVKFARDEPAESELSQLLQSANDLIDETAPLGEEQPGAAQTAEAGA